MELEGGEPANTYVVLKQSGAVRREEEGRSELCGTCACDVGVCVCVFFVCLFVCPGKKPRDLAGLVANFHLLIMSRGTAGISTRCVRRFLLSISLSSLYFSIHLKS